MIVTLRIVHASKIGDAIGLAGMLRAMVTKRQDHGGLSDFTMLLQIS